ncbi:hypothetical protein FrEUN1fDRAFT_7623 [Parafrankia sp. EUN1f]|nr:hypothetical protein FrEUN1fDRAFT_7623 [Parafrankia sp. EUN1f]
MKTAIGTRMNDRTAPRFTFPRRRRLRDILSLTEEAAFSSPARPLFTP